jgi:putative aminopeptidase FrvX
LIDPDRITRTLLDLLAIPSPCGFTDDVVRYVCRVLDGAGIDYELTRRGTIRARIAGTSRGPARALVTHVDTIGAMVRALRSDGRLMVAPIGHWSSRFAEGARVTVFSEELAHCAEHRLLLDE